MTLKKVKSSSIITN